MYFSRWVQIRKEEIVQHQYFLCDNYLNSILANLKYG
jgi:hypothetical protein